MNRNLLAVLASAGFFIAGACSSSTDDRIAELESKIADARIALLEEEVQDLTAAADATTTSLVSADATHDASETSLVTDEGTESDDLASIDFAQQYLDWISPSNCAIATAVGNEPEIMGSDGIFYEYEWPTIGTRLAANYRPAAESLSDAIKAAGSLEWSDDLQGSVDAVIVEMSEYLSILWGFANARTFAEWNVALNRAVNHAGRSQASLLRTKLGLPTNIGDESDYCASLDAGSGVAASTSSGGVDGAADVPRYFQALSSWSRVGAEEMLAKSAPRSAAWAYARHLQQGFRAGSTGEGGATISVISPGELDFCLGSSCFKLNQIVANDGIVETFAVDGKPITDRARAWSLGEMDFCLSFEVDFGCDSGDAFVMGDLTSIYRVNSTTYVTFEVAVSETVPGPVTFAGASVLDTDGLHGPTGDVSTEVLPGGRAVWMIVLDGIDVSNVLQMELRILVGGSSEASSLWFSPQARI